MEGRLTMALNSQQEICALQKGGGIPVAVSTILQCSRIAAAKVHEITSLIKKALDDHNQARIKTPVPAAVPSGTQRVHNSVVHKEQDAAEQQQQEQEQHEPPHSPERKAEEESETQATMDVESNERGLFKGGQSAWDEEAATKAPTGTLHKCRGLLGERQPIGPRNQKFVMAHMTKFCTQPIDTVAQKPTIKQQAYQHQHQHQRLWQLVQQRPKRPRQQKAPRRPWPKRSPPLHSVIFQWPSSPGPPKRSQCLASSIEQHNGGL
jgi:hypothetical protein